MCVCVWCDVCDVCGLTFFFPLFTLDTEDGFQSGGELVDDARVLFAFLGRHGNKLLALLVVPKSLHQVSKRRARRRELFKCNNVN